MVGQAGALHGPDEEAKDVAHDRKLARPKITHNRLGFGDLASRHVKLPVKKKRPQNVIVFFF